MRNTKHCESLLPSATAAHRTRPSSRRAHALWGGMAVAILASAASADITITLANRTFSGFSYQQIMDYASGQQAVGTLTALSINMTLNASVNQTYANDISIYIGPSPIANYGRVQVGGYDTWLPLYGFYSWAGGNSDTVGTTVTGTVTLTQALSFVGDAAIDGTIYIGNGYNYSATSGTWTGTITLIGIDQVVIPAPGALALLGMARLGRSRRRSR